MNIFETYRTAYGVKTRKQLDVSLQLFKTNQNIKRTIWNHETKKTKPHNHKATWQHPTLFITPRIGISKELYKIKKPNKQNHTNTRQHDNTQLSSSHSELAIRVWKCRISKLKLGHPVPIWKTPTCRWMSLYVLNLFEWFGSKSAQMTKPLHFPLCTFGNQNYDPIFPGNWM